MLLILMLLYWFASHDAAQGNTPPPCTDMSFGHSPIVPKGCNKFEPPPVKR